MDLILCVALFRGWPQQWQLKQKKDFIKINSLQTCFILLIIEVFLGVYMNKLIFFFFIIMLA
jgi:hypothetical protein